LTSSHLKSLNASYQTNNKMAHSSNLDLSNSITMHPHPFHLYPNRPESTRSSTHTPVQSPTPRQAATTALEVLPTNEEHDAISRHTTSGTNDIEGQRPPRYTRENDPYYLSSSFKTPSEISAIRANSSRKRDGCGPVLFSKDASQAKKIQGFYESQNETIERMLKPVDDHRAEAKQEQSDSHLKYQIAVYGSFVANVFLAGLQLYGAISSGSLSLFTTMADAIFDPLSNVTLILTNRAVSRVDPRKFPSGKARLETVGNITFCFLMTAVSFILVAFSARDLVVGQEEQTNTFHLPSVIAVAIAFTTKLGLFLYCCPSRISIPRSTFSGKITEMTFSSTVSVS